MIRTFEVFDIPKELKYYSQLSSDEFPDLNPLIIQLGKLQEAHDEGGTKEKLKANYLKFAQLYNLTVPNVPVQS